MRLKCKRLLNLDNLYWQLRPKKDNVDAYPGMLDRRRVLEEEEDDDVLDDDERIEEEDDDEIEEDDVLEEGGDGFQFPRTDQKSK